MRLPVLVIAFNRPGLTAPVLDRIREAEPAAIYAAVDGPRAKVPGDRAAVDAVRDLFAADRWSCPVHQRFPQVNEGVRRAIPAAIDWFFSEVEEGIVLEDDCLVDPSFFPFCEQVLAAHRDDPTVMHVGASNFQPPGHARDASYYWSTYSHNWGWATWRDAWAHYDIDMRNISEAAFDERLEQLFRRRRDRRYWQLMFRYARSGKVETWDYSWMFTMWHRGGRAATPTTNLVTNLGFGSASTHTHDPDSPWAAMASEAVPLPVRPPRTDAVDRQADEWTSDVFYDIRAKARTGFAKVRLALLLPVGVRLGLKRLRARATAKIRGG